MKFYMQIFSFFLYFPTLMSIITNLTLNLRPDLKKKEQNFEKYVDLCFEISLHPRNEVHCGLSFLSLLLFPLFGILPCTEQPATPPSVPCHTTFKLDEWSQWPYVFQWTISFILSSMCIILPFLLLPLSPAFTSPLNWKWLWII